MENCPTNIRFLPFGALNGYRITQQLNVGSESRLLGFRFIFYQLLVVLHICNKRVIVPIVPNFKSVNTDAMFLKQCLVYEVLSKY